MIYKRFTRLTPVQLKKGAKLRSRSPSPIKDPELENVEVEELALGGIIKDEWLQTFPERVRSWLKSHGNEEIKSIQVCRDPIDGTVKSVINAISLGTLNKVAREKGIDNFFHLYLLINGKYRMEKNQVINFGSGSKGQQCETIKVIPAGLTIEKFVDNAISKMGKARFFQYSAFKYNCQDFVSGLLKSNGISAPMAFINQNAEQVAKEMPWYVEKTANLITDLAAGLDLVRQKLGFEKGGIVPPNVVQMPTKDYLMEHKRLIHLLQTHGLNQEANRQIQELKARKFKL